MDYNQRMQMAQRITDMYVMNQPKPLDGTPSLRNTLDWAGPQLIADLMELADRQSVNPFAMLSRASLTYEHQASSGDENNDH